MTLQGSYLRFGACYEDKTRSYYRKQNAADMYMQDVLQPKSVFFTVCMI
jgi:hypothetical protein